MNIEIELLKEEISGIVIRLHCLSMEIENKMKEGDKLSKRKKIIEEKINKLEGE